MRGCVQRALLGGWHVAVVSPESPGHDSVMDTFLRGGDGQVCRAVGAPGGGHSQRGEQYFPTERPLPTKAACSLRQHPAISSRSRRPPGSHERVAAGGRQEKGQAVVRVTRAWRGSPRMQRGCVEPGPESTPEPPARLG